MWLMSMFCYCYLSSQSKTTEDDKFELYIVCIFCSEQEKDSICSYTRFEGFDIRLSVVWGRNNDVFSSSKDSAQLFTAK